MLHPVLRTAALQGSAAAAQWIYLLGVSSGVVVEHNEVAIRHVEARQVVHRRFCVIDVLIHHVGRPPSVLVGPPVQIHDTSLNVRQSRELASKQMVS